MADRGDGLTTAELLTDVRLLTVAQPWAWAIAEGPDEGGKDVDNRTWTTKYRGLVLIVAGQRWSYQGQRSPLVSDLVGHVYQDNPRTVLDSARRYPLWGFERCAVLCARELVDVHPAEPDCCGRWGEMEFVEASGKRRLDIYHWRFAGSGRLPAAIEHKGALGLRRAPADLYRRFLEAAAAAIKLSSL